MHRCAAHQVFCTSAWALGEDAANPGKVADAVRRDAGPAAEWWSYVCMVSRQGAPMRLHPHPSPLPRTLSPSRPDKTCLPACRPAAHVMRAGPRQPASQLAPADGSLPPLYPAPSPPPYPLCAPFPPPRPPLTHTCAATGSLAGSTERWRGACGWRAPAGCFTGAQTATPPAPAGPKPPSPGARSAPALPSAEPHPQHTPALSPLRESALRAPPTLTERCRPPTRLSTQGLPPGDGVLLYPGEAYGAGPGAGAVLATAYTALPMAL